MGVKYLKCRACTETSGVQLEPFSRIRTVRRNSGEVHVMYLNPRTGTRDVDREREREIVLLP